jgi:NadR type nicotinamide-nucleotide adenylyltransferase
VIALEDTLLDDDDSQGWAKLTVELLGYVPDAVFTSENYGDPYAKYMGCVHVLVDKERVNVPVSATMVRSDPKKYWEFLEPCVRAYFARRVCLVGAESTGKTTLAMDLAKHYKTAWVPEYGRIYAEGKLFTEAQTWQSREFIAIAKNQIELEDALAESGKEILICDTDALTTGIWHERYMGTRSKDVETLAAQRKYSLYIVTGDEIPWEQDGTRDSGHVRSSMHQKIIERLKEGKKPYIEIKGSREERLQKAIVAIDAL